VLFFVIFTFTSINEYSLNRKVISTRSYVVYLTTLYGVELGTFRCQ
jgi:hypothetical protein